jgi:hypothetical protein
MGEETEARSFRVDAREVLHSVLEGGDKAKTEIVRVVAREVRSYFEELGLKDDLHNLLTNYSFEVRASVNLRRLTDLEKGESAVPRPPAEPAPEKEAEPRPAPAEKPAAE